MAALDRPVELVRPPDAEGPRKDCEGPEDMALRLSLAKAESVAQGSSSVVVGADTVVVLDGEVFGKPAGATEAKAMLGRLRGRAHHVVTGVTVLDRAVGQVHASATTTSVVMRRYADAEVEAYLATGSSLDKAGAYGVQDSPFRPAERVDGCYLNVVGLPLCEVVSLLGRTGAPARLRPGWRRPPECRDCALRPEGEGTRQ
jgi:MAF protein